MLQRRDIRLARRDDQLAELPMRDTALATIRVEALAS